MIAVPDLKASAAFYRDVLGFTIHEIPDPGWLFYTCGDCTIMAGQCPDQIHPSQLGDHSYFAYLEIADIDAFYKSVVAAGAKLDAEREDGVDLELNQRARQAVLRHAEPQNTRPGRL